MTPGHHVISSWRRSEFRAFHDKACEKIIGDLEDSADAQVDFRFWQWWRGRVVAPKLNNGAKGALREKGPFASVARNRTDCVTRFYSRWRRRVRDRRRHRRIEWEREWTRDRNTTMCVCVYYVYIDCTSTRRSGGRARCGFGGGVEEA